MADERYEKHKERARQRQADITAAGQEIGPLPPVKDPARRNAALDSLERFCLDYFPRRFSLPFGNAHRSMIATIERCTNDGGKFAVAFQRGGGKTSIAEVAVIRAIVCGLRRYAVLLQATGELAKRSLRKIKWELENNPRLLDDFPEVCYPIRRLDRSNRKAQGQKLDGVPTAIEWTANGVVLPTVAGSAASGGIIQVGSIEGAVRGLSMPGTDGEVLRPDMIVIDDAQTRESARSPIQTNARETVICDDVMGLAGPTSGLAVLNLCTPIYVNDLAERFLDHDRHPEFQGLRTRMLESFPKDMAKWDEYYEIRRIGFRPPSDEGKAATDFYRANRAAMDEGAKLSWPERRQPGELSALQGAMNLYYENPRGFQAEYQCDPQSEALADGAKEMNALNVAARLSGLDRLIVPRECTRLTAFIDPGLSLVWYAVVAWNEKGGGSVIDYGCYPKQARGWFEARDARPPLAAVHPGMTEPQLVFAGLQAATAQVFGQVYTHESGGEVKVERCLIDCGWNSSAVFQFIRQSPHAALLYPSKGIGRTTSARGVSEWAKRPGERVGYFWRLTVPESGRVRMCQFDPDAWKSKLHELLTTPLGGANALTLFGDAKSRDRRPDHEMIAAHCAAEYSEPITLRGATFDKWSIRPERPDNHLLDCLVGSAVAASVAGLEWHASGQPVAAPEPRKKVTYAEQRKKLEARAKV